LAKLRRILTSVLMGTLAVPALQSCDDCGDGGSKAEAQGEMLGRNNAKLY